MQKLDFLSITLSDYYRLHHRSKYKIISDYLKSRFDLPDHKHKIAVKCFYYYAEISHNSLKRLGIFHEYLIRSLDKGHIFKLDFKRLGNDLKHLKSQHLSDLQEKRKKNPHLYNKKIIKKGVYVALSLDYKKRLDKIVKSEKISLKSLIQNFIDSKLPKQS